VIIKIIVKTNIFFVFTVLSQVGQRRTITNRSRRSVATKMIQQINCKLGGAMWTTSNPSALEGTMVVGFDVSKDTVNKGVAYGAVVASMDDAFTQYFSQVFYWSNKGIY
jgi:aubergine